MPLVGQNHRPKAVVAAASRKQIDPRAPWQRSEALDAAQLYELYRRLGQVRYGLHFKANAAAKINYYVARRQPGDEPERVDEPQVVEAMDRLGDFAAIVSEFCLHLDIPGEGYLVGQTREEQESWDVWSPVEYNQARSASARRSPDAISPLQEDDFVLRIWRPDPEYREKPDSPLRAVAPEAEQYILLRDMVTSMAQSRLPAGILAVAQELSFPTEVEGRSYSSFFDYLTDSMIQTVQDTRSAGRIAPITVEIPGSQMENAFSFVDMQREMPDWVTTLMERILRQMATGLDLPAEILLGMADVNHWGQWLIDDSARLNHVDPLVILILDSLTEGYLQPALREAGVANPDQYLFSRDYSDLTSRTLTVEEAVALFDRGVISAEGLRRIADIDEGDAGDDEPIGTVEDIEETGEQIRRGPPAIAAAASQETALYELGDIDQRLYTQISEASQAALDRALEKAGAKIRTHATRGTRHPTLAAAIDGMPNDQVGLTLGPSIRETLQLSDDDLIPEGTFDSLGSRILSILKRGQDDTATAVGSFTGTTPDRDEDTERGWRERARDFLIGTLSALALQRLFTPDLSPDPAETGEIGDTAVPAGDVWDALTLAGGGEPGPADVSPRGLAEGQQSIDWITEAGFRLTQREWRVGAPQVPFEPHHAINGVRFTNWTDEQLATPGYASWVGPFLFPGDHKSCQCSTVPVVVPAEELAEAV